LFERGGHGKGKWVVTVLKVHFNSRAIGRLAHPYIEIFAFSGFEKEHIIAIIKVGEFVELIKFGFGVEFRIFTTVRKKRVEIVEEMTVPEEEI
jgi:hypothetical protein